MSKLRLTAAILAAVLAAGNVPAAPEPADEAGRDRLEIIGELTVGRARSENPRIEEEYDPEALLAELAETDPEEADKWERILALWDSLDEIELKSNVLPDGLPKTDELAIVALGYELEPDGSMAYELKERLQVVLRSSVKYPRARIVCTGGGTARDAWDVTEAGAMADWLIENGVDPDRILVEDKAMSTAQNAVRTLELLAEKAPEVTALAIVTSDYHVPLGVLAFGAETILRGGEGPAVVGYAGFRTAVDSFPEMFYAAVLLELAGDRDAAYAIYYDTSPEEQAGS